MRHFRVFFSRVEAANVSVAPTGHSAFGRSSSAYDEEQSAGLKVAVLKPNTASMMPPDQRSVAVAAPVFFV